MDDRRYPITDPTSSPTEPSSLLTINGILPNTDIDMLNTDIADAAIQLLSGDGFHYQCNQEIIEISLILQRRYQLINSSLALLTPETVQNALKIRPLCRMERFILNSNGTITSESQCSNLSGNWRVHLLDSTKMTSKQVEVVLDIAHNEAAMLSLMEKLKYTYQNKKFRLVFGISGDKNIIKVIEAIKNSQVVLLKDDIYCVQVVYYYYLVIMSINTFIGFLT